MDIMHKKLQKYAFVLILFLALAMPQPVNTNAEIREPQKWKNPQPVEVINKYADEYNIDPVLITKVMQCESSGRENAIGDGGKARNVMQFHEPTFNHFEKQLGEDLTYDSMHDQIKLASYMFSKGKQSHWTCFYKVTR